MIIFPSVIPDQPSSVTFSELTLLALQLIQLKPTDMNGIFPADVAVYLLLTPVVVYIFFAHRWTGFLPWYYLSVFCLARIIGGILGIHDSNGLPANIIQSVGLTPLILAVDGLVHEGFVIICSWLW